MKRDGGRGRGRFDRGCSRKRGDAGFARGDRDRDEESDEDGPRGPGDRGARPGDGDDDQQSEEDTASDDDRQSDDDTQDDEDTRGPRGDRGTFPVGVDGGIGRTR